MPFYNENSSLNWETGEKAFVLYKDGGAWGRMVHEPLRYDVDIGPYFFQLFRKGLIEPQLTINGLDGRELGKVSGLNRFELLIEVAAGDCYIHRQL